jgi:hypothetical protein
MVRAKAAEKARDDTDGPILTVALAWSEAQRLSSLSFLASIWRVGKATHLQNGRAICCAYLSEPVHCDA